MSEILQFTTKNRGGSQTHWIHKSEWDTLKAFEKRQQLRMANGWYNHPKFMEREEAKRHLKYAWVLVGNTRRMVVMENEMGPAYKLQGYEVTWMPWKNFKFVRWCTPHDL